MFNTSENTFARVATLSSTLNNDIVEVPSTLTTIPNNTQISSNNIIPAIKNTAPNNLARNESDIFNKYFMFNILTKIINNLQ